MSIVRPRLVGARVLDLCAGSGALGLEALSRGAAHCDFVESDPKVCAALRANIAALGAEDRATVHRAEAGAFVLDRAERWDLAFADPPYAEPTAAALSARWIAAPFAAVLAVEHEGETPMPPPQPGATLDVRRYGRTAVSIYSLDSEAS